MSAVSAWAAVRTARGSSPRSGRRGRADPTSSERWPWSVTLAVAAVSALVPLVALVAIADAPNWSGTADSPADWRVLAAPLSIGIAVVLSRIRVEAAVLALCLAVLTVVPAANQALSGVGVWQSVAGFALYAGVCWITGSLGRQLSVRWSTPWMVGYVAAVMIGLDFDAPITMLGVGWWLVGVTIQHREQLTTRLQARADELGAEQERFAAEAVRLERARIARELHDVVAHCMTVIVIQARAGQQLADVDPAAAVEALDAVLITAAEAERDLDTLVGVMDPPARALTRDLLETFIQRATASGAEVRLDLRGDPGSLDVHRAEVAHRVVQEALTNALRYAPGAPVSIELDCERGLHLAVTNEPEPTGAAPATTGSGRGLAGVAERAAALGGTADWGPTPSGGWRLAVSVP